MVGCCFVVFVGVMVISTMRMVEIATMTAKTESNMESSEAALRAGAGAGTGSTSWLVVVLLFLL